MRRLSIKGCPPGLLLLLCMLLLLTGCSQAEQGNSTEPNPAPAGMEREEADEQAVILEFTDRAVTLAPSNYDGDNPEAFAAEIREAALAEEVTVYNLSIQTVVNADGEETSEETYESMTLEDIRSQLEYGPVSVYLWYDDAGAARKILVWGETVVYE